MATATLQPLNINLLTFGLKGTTPLICHAWDPKTKQQMLDKQQKKAAQPRAAKNPEEQYNNSLYRTSDGGYGFPAVAFKAAAVRAGTLAGMKMTETRQMFRILPDDGDLVRIEGEPSMREDMVRVQQSADIRYRGEFKQWSVVLTVQYDADVITEEQIVNLFARAGFAVGVGEWRMEKNGNFGCFEINTDIPMQKTKKG